jgi:hypothetical protein
MLNDPVSGPSVHLAACLLLTHSHSLVHVHKHGEHHGQHREHAEPARSPAGKGRQEPREEGVEITGTSNINEPDWHETATTADDKAHYHEWIANIRVEVGGPISCSGWRILPLTRGFGIRNTR